MQNKFFDSRNNLVKSSIIRSNEKEVYSFINSLFITRLFYCILVLHIILWTISPIITRYTISHDSIEAFVWGQHLDFGYDKNPYWIGWITHFALAMRGDEIFTYYLLQQLFVGLGFWSIWKLGNLLFNPQKAFVAVLIYEGCLYFSAYTHTNNDNFVLIGLWGLAAYSFFLACKTQFFRYWLVTSIALGLATMAKYSTIIFMAGLFLYLVTEKNARQSLRQPAFYSAILIFIVICLPNILWLFHHHFITFHYLYARSNAGQNISFFGHPKYTWQFIQRTLLNFLGCIVLFLFTAPKWITKFERNKTITQYIWCISIFPLALILPIALALGQRLYWEWGAPFTIFWGLLLVKYFRHTIKSTVLQRFFIAILAAMTITFFSNLFISGYLRAGSGSADYPAQQIANYATQVWREKYHTPLPFVVGNRYTAGYVGFYAPDKPKVFVEWNELFSPGVSEEDIKKHGAIFIQDNYLSTDSHTLPQFSSEVITAYPQLIMLPVKTFLYHRSKKGATVTVLLGILPPQGFS